MEIFLAAIKALLAIAPDVLSQHWNGNGEDGKVNNAVQIVKDAAALGGTLEENLAQSVAANNPHPELVDAAKAGG